MRIPLMTSGKKKTWKKIRSLFGSSIIQYIPMVYDNSGTVARDVSNNGLNGVYTGVDLQNTAAPGGGKAPYFDGVNDYVNLYSAGLASAFDPASGSAILLTKVYNAGVLSDGAYRNCIYIRKDASNYIVVEKRSTANSFALGYTGGGTSVYQTLSYTSTGWQMLAINWGDGGNVVSYLGDTVNKTNALPAGWIGGSLDSNNCKIGTSSWNGWLDNFILLNRPVTQTELTKVKRLFGL